MSKKVSFGKAVGHGVKDTIAITLITVGINEIQKGDYLIGGGIVAVGWILLVVEKLMM